ncbi:hypothetical protein ACFX2J_010647 [Malus domestica]
MATDRDVLETKSELSSILSHWTPICVAVSSFRRTHLAFADVGVRKREDAHRESLADFHDAVSDVSSGLRGRQREAVI